LSGLSTCARFPLSPRIQTLRAILAGACRRALAGAEGVCAAALHPSAKAPLRLVSSMPVLPRPERLSLHDAINYVAERCQSETEKAGKAVLAALSEGALAASANVLVSDRSYLPGVVAGPLPVGPPRRVDAGTGPVPPELWAGYPWPDFLRRAVLPRGNPMYRKQTADGHGVGPVYSDPMIATTDIDGWLERDGGSHKVPASRVGEEKRPIGTIHEAKQGLDLTPQQIMEKIAKYERWISGVLSRFRNYKIADTDTDIFFQLVIEIADLFTDALGRNSYTTNIMNLYNHGVQNVTGRPSFKCVQDILNVIRAAHTRLERNPRLLKKKKDKEHTLQIDNVFIIHGRNEAKRRELKEMVANTFHLKPIILSEQPNIGRTVIEKFEHYAETCSYAIALFTPDDEVHFNEETYLQARPNVIYELGWFCGRLGRSSTMLLLKEGTSMFTDFAGIIQMRFKANVSELEGEIRKDLIAAGILG